jgi:MoxR-like ATPase/predicted  nucleic acid-binding Zn-ribbon protein
MPSTQLLQWSLWGLSLLAGVGAILALFKLRYAERFLPEWNGLKELEAILPVRREELRQATEGIDQCRAEIGQLEATVGNLRILKEWQNANPEAPARIQQMMTDLERCKSELAAVQLKLAQDQQLLNDVTQEANRLNLEKAQLTQETGTLRDQLAGFHKQKAELEKGIRDLDDQYRQCGINLSALKEQVTAADAALARLRSELEQVVKEKREGTGERDQIRAARDTAKVELASTTKRVELATNALNQLQERNETLSKEKRRLEDDTAALTKQRDSLSNDCLKAQEELRKLGTKLEEMTRERRTACTERDQATAHRDIAREELRTLQKLIDTTKAHLDNLNAQLQTAGIGPTDISKALEDLAQPALKFAFNRGAKLDESTALRGLDKHLTAKGLHFPERVQLAFHTSLKAAHINPLVVLAGVSGTGKSALPMAYAEATGMNFVSLAVQPGWSGPQDLLGFYNYLERKYKATELARALAQMSRFSGEDLPGLKIQSRKDQMLLLLLDEMNLARIEYYFSDFLSRLEQRGGRNIEDPQRRREVSLLVDAGSLPATEAPRFIFPDYNVLFVGTMNEDESTQSLSDKVIDRANVLRFGAPKELRAAPAKTVVPTADFLPRKTWEEQWVKPFDENTFERERTILTQLNDTLETINRPFGHRVYRAILDYLANYPGASTDPARCRNALADQMEQKIIPKLRGLDTQDVATENCLDLIGKTIGDIQDEELAKAFTRARQQHLFEWFGVKRT